jgi:membrane protease YdiL (CAAX protease family)
MEANRDTPPNVMNFAVIAALFEGGLAIFAVSLGWAIDIRPMASFHWSWIDLAWGAAATLPPLGVLGACLYAPWKPFRVILRLMRMNILPHFRECRLIEIAIIALLAGLGEEMLFRPIVQGGLAQWIGSPYGLAAGLAASAIVFGLLHAITPAYAMLAGIIGLYLGVIWQINGNLLVPIAAHAIYDFLAIFVLLRKVK